MREIKPVKCEECNSNNTSVHQDPEAGDWYYNCHDCCHLGDY